MARSRVRNVFIPSAFQLACQKAKLGLRAPMELKSFLAKHLDALEADQARHNLMLGLINRAQRDPSKVRIWSLGEGAACAIQTPPHYIVLGDLNRTQCEELAQTVVNLDFIGCVGPDDTTEMLASCLTKLGIAHELERPQRIYTLDQPPTYPNCKGRGRKSTSDDKDLFCDWFMRFIRETAPNEPPFTKERMIETFIERPVYFWEVDGKNVSMAARNRETKNGSNISFVFTPPELRGNGYAGSVTAFACEDVFKDGKKVCFLYTDLRNPISNRVYQKIGFRPWCDSKIYARLKTN